MLRVKEVLKNKGMTQVELANSLNISVVGLNKIINGNPTIETLQKMAYAMNVEVRDLFNVPKNAVNGFIEYENTIHRIYSKADLENLLQKM